MTVEVPDILLIIISALGGVIAILLGVLVKKSTRSEEKIDSIQAVVNSHILKMAETMPTFMSVAQCGHVRGQCIEMNKQLIAKPLQEHIDGYIEENDAHWARHESETDRLWQAVRKHIHTHPTEPEKDRVVLNGYDRS